jgi:hypothetical protein
MQRVCLDTNALNRLARTDHPRAEALHAKLRYAGSNHIFVVSTVLDELAPMLADPRAADPADHANQIVNFLLSGIKVRGLLPPLERIELEVRAALEGHTPPLWAGLYPVQSTRAALAQGFRDRLAVAETLAVLKESHAAIDEERTTRLDILRDPPAGFDLRQVNLRNLIDMDVQKNLENGAYGLPSDKSRWPASDRVPSLWNLYSILWAYRYVNLGNASLKERPSDAPDILIYRDTAYADVFVTDDARLKRYVDVCPQPRATVMTLDAWLATV